MNNDSSAEQLPTLVLAAARGAADLQASDLVVLDVGDVIGTVSYTHLRAHETDS